jgi:hypothetical protein
MPLGRAATGEGQGRLGGDRKETVKLPDLVKDSLLAVLIQLVESLPALREAVIINMTVTILTTRVPAYLNSLGVVQQISESTLCRFQQVATFGHQHPR